MNSSTDSQDSPARRPASRQRLTPLFAMASIMVAVGYYLAITQSQDPNTVRPAEHSIASSETITALGIDDATLDTSIRGVRFVYAPLETQKSRLDLRQDSSATEAEGEPVRLRTQLELSFEEVLALRKELLAKAGASEDELPEMIGEATASALDNAKGEVLSAEELAATRTYTNVRAAIHTEQKDTSGVLGQGISAQVADLLEGSVTRTFLQPNGENNGFEWRDVPNPEARRILYLVRDAQAFLTPRFTADALNPGDTWSYERPLWVDPDDQTMRAEGTIKIANRFAGTLEVDGRHLGVIRQTLEGQAEGEVRGEGATKFTMEGSGSGVFLVDLERGNRVAADLDFERTLSVETEGAPAVQSSKIVLNLRPEAGLELPTTLQAAHEANPPEPASP